MLFGYNLNSMLNCTIDCLNNVFWFLILWWRVNFFFIIRVSLLLFIVSLSFGISFGFGNFCCFIFLLYIFKIFG